jgi:FAD/FMN-containing dehydrogenase
MDSLLPKPDPMKPLGRAIDGPDIAQLIRQRIGADRVETDLDRRIFFSTDMSARGPTAAAVVRPRSSDELASAVQLCTEHGKAAIPRGGGFSYTGGYLPVVADSVIIDLRALDSILEINAEDMYVVVEAGCTWHNLYEALKARGLRTPYFGPMSGYSATVGGAISQGSFFLGSSQYGPVAESVLALEVVLADGSILRTGSWGSTIGALPFYRTYGPDLTGLFLGDTGALGFKSKAVLKLLPFPEHQRFGSFAFTDEQSAVRAISAIGRSGLAAECYCWDPYFVKVMAAATSSIAEDLKYLKGVATGGGSKLRGLLNAARVAAAGKRVFDGAVFMLNVTVDDASQGGAEGRIKIIRDLAVAAGGREIAPSAPMTMRGTPFTNFNTAERRSLIRNLPTNGVTPHSRLPAVSRDIRELLNRRQEEMDAQGMECGTVYLAVGAQAVCIEPLLFWEDEQHFSHDRITERSDLDALGRLCDSPEATRLAGSMRKEFSDIFRRHGCAHVQIGKSYPWLETREPALKRLAVAMKAAVDPHGLVNPGSLGLDGGG